MKNKMNNKGFSLVELIVVIAIMAILVGVLAPSVIGQLDKAKLSKDKQSVDAVATAVAIAFTDPDISDSKSITAFPVVHTAASQSVAIGSPNFKNFMSVIYNTVGFKQVLFESNEFKDCDQLEVDINETTGKVTVIVPAADTASNTEYKITK